MLQKRKGSSSVRPPVFLLLQNAALPRTRCLAEKLTGVANCENCKIIYIRAGMVMCSTFAITYPLDICNRLCSSITATFPAWAQMGLHNPQHRAPGNHYQSELASKMKPLSSLHDDLVLIRSNLTVKKKYWQLLLGHYVYNLLIMFIYIYRYRLMQGFLKHENYFKGSSRVKREKGWSSGWKIELLQAWNVQ